MIMKCRDMERVMAASSQKLLHGGMRTRDWFSDKLEKEIRDNKIVNVCVALRNLWSHLQKYTCRPGVLYSDVCASCKM